MQFARVKNEKITRKTYFCVEPSPIKMCFFGDKNSFFLLEKANFWILSGLGHWAGLGWAGSGLPPYAAVCVYGRGRPYVWVECACVWGAPPPPFGHFLS